MDIPWSSTPRRYDTPDIFQIAGLHEYDEDVAREGLDAIEAAPQRLAHQAPPNRGGVSTNAPDFFQPRAHPPPKETKYAKVIFRGQVLMEPHIHRTTKGFRLAPTPRHLLPTSRSARGQV